MRTMAGRIQLQKNSGRESQGRCCQDKLAVNRQSKANLTLT
jgi:hypothetical protein